MAINRKWTAKDGGYKRLRATLKDDDGVAINLDTWGDITLTIRAEGEDDFLVEEVMTKLDQATYPGMVTYGQVWDGVGTYEVEIEGENPDGFSEKFPSIEDVPFGTLKIERSH
jgi:hypothetical protein